ncbi:NYN domain-containing protein [Oxalobacteraceae bacterium A2-2]
MASSNDNVSMALFCDFENVALGVRDANYDKFDIKPVLERLLLKGSIVVKKAYCDWDRYKGFKASMHEANFELIEIPHVRQSGKNSADIRMVVDALDLCYTKSHVDTFVIISGDSDFSPLVSKLRENAKKVIGVGVKQSTSDLLVANCDEFIFYDDLVRESRRAKREASSEAKPAVKRTPEEERARREEMDKRRNQAVEIAINTFEALVLERGDTGKIWASVLKEAIKRRKPDFSESYYGFRTFGNLIEEAKARGLLEFGRDEKSGAYVYRSSGVPAPVLADAAPQAEHGEAPVAGAERPEGFRVDSNRGRDRDRNRNGRNRNRDRNERQQGAQAEASAGTPYEAGAASQEEGVQPVILAPVAEVAEQIAEAVHEVADQPSTSFSDLVEQTADAVHEVAEPETAGGAKQGRSNRIRTPARKAKAAAKGKAQAAAEASAGPAADAAPVREQPAARPATPVQETGPVPSAAEAVPATVAAAEIAAEAAAAEAAAAGAAPGKAAKPARPAKTAKPVRPPKAAKPAKADAQPAAEAAAEPVAAPATPAQAAEGEAAAKPARKPAARPRRPAAAKAKPKTTPEA